MIIKVWKSLTVVILLTVLVGSSMKVGAADSAVGSPLSARWTTAKILLVDRNAKAVTVDIHGTVHLLWLNASLKVRKDGKDAGMPDLVPGQVVYLNVMMTPGGNDVERVLQIALYSAGGTGPTGLPPGATPGTTPGAGDATKNAGEQGRGVPSLFTPAPIVRPTVSPYY